MKRLAIMLYGTFFMLAATLSLHPRPALAQGDSTLKPPAGIGERQNATNPPNDAAQGMPQDPSRMRIGPGDLIDVSVFDVPELAQEVRVSDTGDASFSLIGPLHLAGLSVEQARSLIAQRLKDKNLLLDPKVALLIREYNTQGVSVVGEVTKPGVYGVLGTQSLLDVVAAAGGTTPFAGPDVTIKRYADGTTATVHLTRDAQASLSSDVRLYPGDKVVIPRAALVYVMGDVGRPGGFVMENDGKLTLLEALAMAGGPHHTASLSHARLISKTSEGYSEVPIHLKKIIEGEEADPQLQAEEILYVPSNAVKSAFYRTAPSIVSATSAAAVYHSMP